jgi:hypothetical protein
MAGRQRGWSCDCDGDEEECPRCRAGTQLLALAQDAETSAAQAADRRLALARALREAYSGPGGWTLDELTGATHLSRTQVHRIVAGVSVPDRG